MRSKYLIIIVLLGVVNLLLGWQVYAGSPDSPGPPESTSSYTLADLYNRLSAGTTGSQSTFTEPTTAPGTGTMHTLNGIMAVAPAQNNTNGATSTHVLSGQTYWGLTSGQWGVSTGTMANNGAVNLTPGTSAQAIAAGYHNGSGTVAGDADLIAGNIKKGVDLFGVNGTLPVGGVGKTGQITCFDASSVQPCPVAGFPGQDGEYQKGVSVNPRFTDNGDGTVTDNLTGLIWLKNANCANAGRNWQTALTDVTQLNANGQMNGSICGDVSNGGSHQTDWRLPNVKELESLVDFSQNFPALPSGHPFMNVQSNYYWSSTTVARLPTYDWVVVMNDGFVTNYGKNGAGYVWPVRGGQ